jgi:hypothetical protein
LGSVKMVGGSGARVHDAKVRVCESLNHAGVGPLAAILLAPVGRGIMRYMGLVEIAAILLFVALVVFAVWWVVTRLRG